MGNAYLFLGVGSALIIIGAVWSISIFLYSTEKLSESFVLDGGQIKNVNLDLRSVRGIGYYLLAVTDNSKLGSHIYVKIADPNGSMIERKDILSKLTVNYFRYDQEGNYSLTIGNIGRGSVTVNMQTGNAHFSELLGPFLFLSSGIGITSFSVYRFITHF